MSITPTSQQQLENTERLLHVASTALAMKRHPRQPAPEREDIADAAAVIKALLVDRAREMHAMRGLSGEVTIQ